MLTIISSTCIECGKEDSSYKCPSCRQPYCSVTCCKLHKEKPCEKFIEPIEATVKQTIKEYDFPSEDTVSLEKLKQLETSAGLKTCLQNPHVRSILEELDKSESPDALFEYYMQEPIFTEVVDECLKIVNPENESS